MSAPAEGTLKYLRSLPASDLLKIAAMPQMSIGPANGVSVDGWVFPKSPAEVFATGREQRLPLLIGNNSRERTPPPASSEDLAKAMEAMYGPLAPRALALYQLKAAQSSVQQAAPDSLYGGAGAQWVVDSMYRCPVVAQLVWHGAAGGVGYEYQFDRAAPGRESAGAVHGAEVPYVFGAPNGGRGANYTDTDRELSSAIQQYWTNFAKNGDPNRPGLPKWSKFDSASRPYMEFTDRGPSPSEGLRRPFCDLYVDNVKRLVAQARREAK